MPKSMLYTGQHDDVPTKVEHFHYNKNELKVTDGFEPLEGYLSYIQVTGLSDVSSIKEIQKHYKVDDIVLEDIFNVKQRNKLEPKEHYLFGVFRCEYIIGTDIKEDYFSLLLFEDTIITFHEKVPIILSPIRNLFENYQELRKRPIDFLFYQVLDIMTDQHLAVYDYLEKASEQFEESILENRQLNQETFYMIRKHLLKLKSNVSPILDNLTILLSKSHPLIKKENKDFFDDLIDHFIRLDNHLNQSREMMRHLLDLHINNQSNKMNRIMTTLTLFSAIFIPLSFLTGFFGMNFVHFEVLEYEHSLIIFIGLCFLLAGFMLLLFKKMKWF